MASFYERVYDVVAQIPCGTVLTYGRIACMLGSPRAARQVGWAMRRCPGDLPWHRVVKADGSIVGGAEGVACKRLEAEGAAILPDGRVDMKKS